MHIAFLVPRYWPDLGGVEKYVHELGKALFAVGHRVTVVAPAYQPSLPDVEFRDGVEIRRFPAYRSPLRCWVALTRMRRRFTKADVVHISNVDMVEYYHRMIGWIIPRRPIFMTRHGMSYQCPVPIEEKRRAARAATLVDGIIDDGVFIAKWLGVPSTAALDQGLSPTTDELDHVPEPPPTSAVFIGRLDWDSGIENYIEAINLLVHQHRPRISLDVYGGGHLQGELRARVERQQLPITFHGWVNDAQNRLTDGCFAFVSGRLAIQEAMARRRLVVATYVNQLKRDYVCEESFSPHLVVGGTPPELAALVIRYAQHNEERARIVDGAFAHAKNLTWHRTAQGFLKLWRSAPVVRKASAPSRLERIMLALRLNGEAAAMAH